MRFILLGTSHCEPIFNPIKNEFTKVFDMPFSNKGVSALSIKSYFPRVLAILNEFPNEKLFFINEIPTGGRYENYLYNPRKKYEPFSITNHKFWSEGTDNEYNKGEWKDHIFYYNLSKLSSYKNCSESTLPVHTKIIKQLIKFVVNYNLPLLEELSMVDALYINAFIKNAGHDVVWFYTKTHENLGDITQKYELEYIVNQPLFSVIEKKYNKKLKELQSDPDVFPDGTHLDKKEWEYLIQKYFIPYFENYIKDKI